MTFLTVRGAREHNLRNITVRLPRDRLVVITGPSGSGKSSLAFDTIYAEGQRRYVESLSAYARQFLDRLPKPDVDAIEGLSPAIAVQQRASSKNPRSTVGTVTEILDYLRLLYARAGEVHCPECDRIVRASTVDEIADETLTRPEGTRFSVEANVVLGMKDAGSVVARLRKEGFARVRLDGKVRDLAELDEKSAARAKILAVVIDRLVVRAGARPRLVEALELATKIGRGFVTLVVGEGEVATYSSRFACADHGVVLEATALEPRAFSFNSPAGACPDCGGLGESRRFDAERVVPDPSRSIEDGAMAPWGKPGGPYHKAMCAALAKVADVALDVPFGKLPKATRDGILHGGLTSSGKRGAKGKETFEGVLPALDRRMRDYERRRREVGADEERTFAFLEEELGRFLARVACGACGGTRLRKETRLVRVGGVALPDLCEMPIDDAKARLEATVLAGARAKIGERVLREARERLGFLVDVGLGYLSLARSSGTLSGGEAQRIRLGTQIGSGLMGVLYVLDEPSIGLHARDNARLLRTLEALRDRGNTVLVVEHDEETIRAADHVVDLGPGAGAYGGAVVAEGPPDAIAATVDSPTGAFLSGREVIEMPSRRRSPTGAIPIRGARCHNLRDLDVDVPLGVLVAVTGVSGSGKSSLVMDTLVPQVEEALARGDASGGVGAGVTSSEEGVGNGRGGDFAKRSRGPTRGRAGDGADPGGAGLGKKAKSSLVMDTLVPFVEEGIARNPHFGIERLLVVDQSAIGRTPRSNPATYVGLFGPLRELYASLPDARAKGYGPGRFSFNVRGGRCEACQGAGVVQIPMHFLPDVEVLCEICEGRRYDRETLEVRYRGASIADALAMEIRDARALFEPHPAIRERLAALESVGLGYLQLGRSATTLSGGEAQRVRLARELGRTRRGPTLYVLDEPTTGLHFRDVAVLLGALQALVDGGHSVVVVEHQLDVVRVADWVIDLGPEGGPHGGTLVAQGTPEAVAAVSGSHTGTALASRLR